MSAVKVVRRFELWRREDESGVSGTGHVASGVEFPDGAVVMRWHTETAATAVYGSIEDVESIHGHGGKTFVFWLDAPQYPHMGERDRELVGLCLRCLGGPFDTPEGGPGRHHHCFDCGASNFLAFVPRYAAKDIREKDKQRVRCSEGLRKELRYLRSRLPVPEDVTAVRTDEDPDLLDGGGKPKRWQVGKGRHFVVVMADTAHEARKKGALLLPWLPEGA